MVSSANHAHKACTAQVAVTHLYSHLKSLMSCVVDAGRCGSDRLAHGARPNDTCMYMGGTYIPEVIAQQMLPMCAVRTNLLYAGHAHHSLYVVGVGSHPSCSCHS